MSERIWSAQQEAIFEWFAHPEQNASRNLVVTARAGTGKTTTMLEASGRAPESPILFCAFNKDIVKEINTRLAGTGSVTKAQTLHGIGFSIVGKYLDGVHKAQKFERTDYIREAMAKWVWETERKRIPLEIVRLISKLNEKAREILPLATEPGSLEAIADEFDCEPDAAWRRAGYDMAFVERCALYAMKVAAEDVEGIKRTGIDYADMIFLPVRNGWTFPAYPLVIVDEGQDMSASQLILAQGVLIEGGRMVIVGDDRQAIYRFRGADSESLSRLTTELGADTLGLNKTYRCGRSIVSFAAQLVPDFLAGAEHEGEVVRIYGYKTLIETAEYGDFILSRKNAPLADVALALLRANKRTAIRGRAEFGKPLIDLVKKLADKSNNSVPEFLRRLDAWREREVTRAKAAGKDEKVESIEDRAQTIEHLTDGVVGVQELCQRIESLFVDDGMGDAGRVLLSSVHKAKGLEADRVFVLRDTLFLRFPRMSKAQEQEEANLAYVAYTRAKHTLVLVREKERAPELLEPVAAGEVRT